MDPLIASVWLSVLGAVLVMAVACDLRTREVFDLCWWVLGSAGCSFGLLAQ